MSSESARAIEAVLMVATDPVDPHLLAQLLEVPPSEIAGLCEELADTYEAEGRGFVLVHVAGGYRFQSHPDLAAYVERFVLEGQSARLSGAALETLAIVAYKQPLSRNQVAAIRGVNVDGVMRTLLHRGYVVEVGRDPGPGQATLFGTTGEFLERLGLASLDDLPAIAELFPSAEVMEALELGLRTTPADPPAAAPAPAPTRTDDHADNDAGFATGTVADASPAPTETGDDADTGTDPAGPAWGRSADTEGPEPVPPAWAVDPEPPPSP